MHDRNSSSSEIALYDCILAGYNQSRSIVGALHDINSNKAQAYGFVINVIRHNSLIADIDINIPGLYFINHTKLHSF